MGMAAGAPSSLVGAAADQLEQRRFVVAFSPQLWHSVACFCAGVACFFASSTIWESSCQRTVRASIRRAALDGSKAAPGLA